MKKDANYARSVANVLYTPTLLASALILLHWVLTGLCLFSLILFTAYKTDVFEQFARWPKFAKVVLYMGAGQILLSLYCSTTTIAYWMIIPTAIQALLNIIAYFVLRTINSKT